jgi:hypothetical protein
MPLPDDKSVGYFLLDDRKIGGHLLYKDSLYQAGLALDGLPPPRNDSLAKGSDMQMRGNSLASLAMIYRLEKQ